MNTKRISVIAGIGAIVLAVIFLSANAKDIAPVIKDDTEFEDKSTLSLGENNQDVPTVADSALVNETGTGFYIDENGVKHYIITAEDEPNLGDQ